MSFRRIDLQWPFRPYCIYESFEDYPCELYDSIRSGYLKLNMQTPNLQSLCQAVEDRMNQSQVQEAVYQKNLTENETKAILIYTADWTKYGIPFEQSLPYLLNIGDDEASDIRYVWKDYFFHLLKGLEKLEVYKGWAFRGINFEWDHALYIYHAYVSCTLLSCNRCAPELNAFKTILKIDVSEKGRLLGNISMDPLEGELLILPYYYYKAKLSPNEPTETIIFTPTPRETIDSPFFPNPFTAARQGNIKLLEDWDELHYSRDDWNPRDKKRFGIVVDKNVNDSSLLHTAARFGQVEVVKFLLDCKVNVNAVQSHGSSALHAAAHYGHLEVVKILVDNRIDVKIVNRWNRTALDEASDVVENGKKWQQIVEILKNC